MGDGLAGWGLAVQGLQANLLREARMQTVFRLVARRLRSGPCPGI